MLDSLDGNSFCFFNQSRHHLGLRDHPDDLALHKQMPFATAARDAEIGLAGFTGAIDHAAHHGHLDRDVQRLESGLSLGRDPDHIDVSPPAGRASDQVQALAFPQPEILEQLTAGLGLFDRIGRE